METKPKNQGKTKSQTQTIEIKNKFYSILIFIGALLFSIAPFVHINMSKRNSEVQAYKKQKKENEYSFDVTIIEKRDLLKNEKISASEFLILTDKIATDKKTYITKSNEELNVIVDRNRVFGFRTKRTFTIGLFVRLPYLLFSITVLGLTLNRKKVKYLTKAIKFLIFNFFFISFYHLIWFLWDSNDLPKSSYYIAVGVISILLSFAFINLIKYLNNKESILKKKIRGLISFITFSRENVVKELAIEASNNSNNKKIERLVDTHENEMWKTLEKTAK